MQSPKGKQMKQHKDGVAVLCIDPQVDFHPGGSLAIFIRFSFQPLWATKDCVARDVEGRHGEGMLSLAII